MPKNYAPSARSLDGGAATTGAASTYMAGQLRRKPRDRALFANPGESRYEARPQEVRRPRTAAGPAVFHLLPVDLGWEIAREGEPAGGLLFETKKLALSRGRRLARRSAPAELVVHRGDGTVQDSFRYEPDRS
jgi:hypothetical protein